MLIGIDHVHIMLNGDPAIDSQHPPHTFEIYIFVSPASHVYCGQTAGWIKMSFGTKVGLDPGHIVLDGNPLLPPPKKMARTDSSPDLRRTSAVTTR